MNVFFFQYSKFQTSVDVRKNTIWRVRKIVAINAARFAHTLNIETKWWFHQTFADIFASYKSLFKTATTLTLLALSPDRLKPKAFDGQAC